MTRGQRADQASIAPRSMWPSSSSSEPPGQFLLLAFPVIYYGAQDAIPMTYKDTCLQEGRHMPPFPVGEF